MIPRREALKRAQVHAQAVWDAWTVMILGLITAFISLNSLAAEGDAFDCPRESGGLRVGTRRAPCFAEIALDPPI